MTESEEVRKFKVRKKDKKRELEKLLYKGCYPARVNDCCIEIFTSALQWERYKSFKTQTDAHNYLQLLTAIYPEIQKYEIGDEERKKKIKILKIYAEILRRRVKTLKLRRLQIFKKFILMYVKSPKVDDDI